MYDIIADEDVPRPVVEKLREEFKIFYIEEEMKGATDEEVMNKSREIESPLLTFDSDFYQYNSHLGILHITQRTNYDTVVEAVKEVQSKLSKEELENSVIQVNPSLYSQEL